MVKSNNGKLLCAFAPIAGEDARVLILGTMPSVKSLEAGFYYAHPRNCFWPLVYSLYGMQPESGMEAKKRFLLARRIALWDVLRCCERQGSGDANIQNEVPNDFRDFLKHHPSIRAVMFNGGPACALFKKHVLPTLADMQGIAFIQLPSTSPAHAAKSFEEKLQVWRAAFEDTGLLV